MDPLSVSASVIAIATVVTQICQALSDLRTLCQSLPGRLHALNNEVADIGIVLYQVASVVEERECLPSLSSGIAHLPQLLREAECKLAELKHIVIQLNRDCNRSTNKIAVFRAGAWKRSQGKLQELQEDIKTIKCNLNILLGASNSYVTFREELLAV